MGWYQTWDAISTSTMESTRNDYKDAIGDVEDYLGEAAVYISTIDDYQYNMDTHFHAPYCDASAGEFVDAFSEKIDFVISEMAQLYDDLLQGLSQVDRTLETLRYRLNTLEAYCVKEDENEKTMTLSEIKW